MACNVHVVDGDSSERCVGELLDRLAKVKSGDFVLENGELIRVGGMPTPHFKSKRFEDQDRRDTAYGHYKHKLLARTFSNWREHAERKRARISEEAIDGPKKPPKMMLEPTMSKVCVPGKTGLRNLGNTCFINSVIQCLSNLPALRDWLINNFMDTSTPIRYNNSVTLWRRGTLDCLTAMSSNVAMDQREISMVLELHYILRVIWSGKWLIVTPYALLDALWRFVPRFRGYVQQDAQEFFSYLLDRINTELTEAMKKINKPFAVPVPLRSSSSSNAAAAAAASASSSLPANQSIVNQVFEGQFVSEVACTKCKNVTRRFEAFLDLELDVIVQSVARRRAGPPESTTLEECLGSYGTWESISDYACEKCKKSVVAEKRIMVSRLPRILCIVLKRFCYTASGALAKNDAGVVFPLMDLDVSNICTNVSGPTTYNLRSLIMHHGLSLRKGHYTSIAYNGEQDCWLHYNDAKVSVISEEAVAASEAYMLFYSNEQFDD